MNLIRSRRPDGVTMVELLCVIAIITILAALMMGPMIKAFLHARKVIGGFN
jgi:prepilin-type N-terminal cleavage/methylation domain-containing protein